MPIYSWRDEVSGKELDVLRSPGYSGDEPTTEEVKQEKLHLEQPPKWVRIFSSALLQRGPNWSGSKGNWLWLLAVLGSTYINMRT